MTEQPERRLIYTVNTYGIHAYEVLKETPKLFKVRGLSRWAWDRQLDKDNLSIRNTIEEARQLLREQLDLQIASYREQIAVAQEELAKVDRAEPEWNTTPNAS